MRHVTVNKRLVLPPILRVLLPIPLQGVVEEERHGVGMDLPEATARMFRYTPLTHVPNPKND
jgi:hypothetical protein